MNLFIVNIITQERDANPLNNRQAIHTWQGIAASDADALGKALAWRKTIRESEVINYIAPVQVLEHLVRRERENPGSLDAEDKRRLTQLRKYRDADFYDGDSDDELDDVCHRCGGEGFIEYDEAGPDVWGEDCPSEANHLVDCPDCDGTGAA